MTNDTPIINILTSRLPYELANLLYNEFQNRHKEALYLITNYPSYSRLKRHLKTVELLLALSIFHRRVISNLESAVKFYGRVSSYGTADTIKIGNYLFDGDEKNKILGVIMSYDKLIEKFEVPKQTMEYLETKDFLTNLIYLLPNNNQTKNGSKNEGTKSQSNEEDLPF